MGIVARCADLFPCLPDLYAVMLDCPRQDCLVGVSVWTCCVGQTLFALLVNADNTRMRTRMTQDIIYDNVRATIV